MPPCVAVSKLMRKMAAKKVKVMAGLYCLKAGNSFTMAELMVSKAAMIVLSVVKMIWNRRT